MEYIKDPREIETKSMAIIEERLKDTPFDPLQKPVIKRVVHTTGDVSFAEITAFAPGAVEAGLQALLAGAPVYCDVEMVRSGINRTAVSELGLTLSCLIHEPAVADEAKRLGTTRAAAAMERTLELVPENGVFVIGNAPTALFVLLENVQAGKARPALVVGTPVGFVGAAESKEWLETFSLPWITVRGEKGGSTVAASIVNALLRLALEKKGGHTP